MHNQRSHNRQPSCHNRTLEIKNRTRKMKKKKAEEPMRTMTKERKKEGPRLGHKGRADAKASRQLLLLCIPAIIAYILFN